VIVGGWAAFWVPWWQIIYGIVFALGIMVLPTYALVFLYVLMVLVLIFRPWDFWASRGKNYHHDKTRSALRRNAHRALAVAAVLIALPFVVDISWTLLITEWPSWPFCHGLQPGTGTTGSSLWTWRLFGVGAYVLAIGVVKLGVAFPWALLAAPS